CTHSATSPLASSSSRVRRSTSPHLGSLIALAPVGGVGGVRSQCPAVVAVQRMVRRHPPNTGDHVVHQNQTAVEICTALPRCCLFASHHSPPSPRRAA